MSTRIPWPWSSLNPTTWFTDVVTWLSHQALGGANQLWALLERTAFITPDVTRLDQVRQLNATSLLIVNVSFVLAILAVGVLVMARDSLQVRYGLAELLPRLVVAFIAANAAPLLVTRLIGLCNAVTAALTGDGIAPTGAFGRLQTTVTIALRSPPNLLLSLILCLMVAGLTAALMVTWLVRIGVLVVLAGIAPLALACHALPQTQPAAALWWRSLWGCLATVVLQALMLHAGLSIFLGDAATRRQLGLSSTESSSLNLFIVLCLLWTTVKIPGLVRRYVTRGGSGRGAGAVVRVLLVQQLSRGLTRALSSAAGGRAAAHRPAHSRRPGPGATGPAGGTTAATRRPAPPGGGATSPVPAATRSLIQRSQSHPARPWPPPRRP